MVTLARPQPTIIECRHWLCGRQHSRIRLLHTAYQNMISPPFTLTVVVECFTNAETSTTVKVRTRGKSRLNKQSEKILLLTRDSMRVLPLGRLSTIVHVCMKGAYSCDIKRKSMLIDNATFLLLNARNTVPVHARSTRSQSPTDPQMHKSLREPFLETRQRS